jgi:hypothetical protein
VKPGADDTMNGAVNLLAFSLSSRVRRINTLERYPPGDVAGEFASGKAGLPLRLALSEARSKTTPHLFECHLAVRRLTRSEYGNVIDNNTLFI